MRINNSKKNRGITLVALVITIIILLILAGITISQLTQSGLFENAKSAKERSEESQKLENTRLEKYENEIGKYVNNTREGNKNEFSLQEHAIGTWINGETIYSKTIYLESLQDSSTNASYEHGITNAKMIWIDTTNSFLIWKVTGGTTPFPNVNTGGAGVIAITEVTNNDLQIKTDRDRSALSAYITLNYIKNN